MPNEKIWLSTPHMGGEELRFVREAFASNWISPVGPHLSAFEDELAHYLGAEQCAVLSSGTAAIHLALIIVGVGAGDEVICSSFTFSGSCNPVVYLGASPVFVDCEPETWNMDPALLREAIEQRMKKTGRKPKAIILVDLYGMPPRMKEILSISHEFGIPLIEDAAEALGSEYLGQKLGTFGDLGIFSFNGNKIITTSGGGAMVSKNGDWIKEARFLATQARDKAPHYEHSQIGYNYRLSNVCAGIGRGQLLVLDDRIKSRRANFDHYQSRLGQLAWIQFLPEPYGFYSNRWLTTVLLPSQEARLTVHKVLEINEIESRPLWKPMHLQPVFKEALSVTNGTSESLFASGLCLPSGSNLQVEDLDRICDIIATSTVTVP